MGERSLLLLGSEGLIKKTEATPDFVSACETVATKLSAQTYVFEDGHFLHMEMAANDVAHRINTFFSSNVNR